MKDQTSPEDILGALEFAHSTARLLDLPLRCTTAPVSVAEALRDKVENLYPVSIYVRSPWEMENK